MRRFHVAQFIYAGISALFGLVLLLPAYAAASRHHAAAAESAHAASLHRHRAASVRAAATRTQYGAAHAACVSAHHARNTGARLVRVHASQRRQIHQHPAAPHTARALRHARRHGTDAVRAAARHEAQRTVQEESPAESASTAALRVPELPLAAMNLPPLRGNRESLVRQNERAEKDGLLRVKDDADLATLRRQGSLVALPELASMRTDSRLAANRRYCRSWTGHFLVELARAHYRRFHTPLQVNSAVRTIEYQRHLLHINGNAAPADGDIASPHLTGAAVDITKKRLTPSEVAWMRAYLLPLQTAGKIDVEEEFQQSCFHISVYKSYVSKDSGPLRITPKPSVLLASGMN